MRLPLSRKLCPDSKIKKGGKEKKKNTVRLIIVEVPENIAHKQPHLCTRTCTHIKCLQHTASSHSWNVTARQPVKDVVGCTFFSLFGSACFSSIQTAKLLLWGRSRSGCRQCCRDCLCHPFKQRGESGAFLPFCVFLFCQFLLDSVDQAEFWFVQLEPPLLPPSSKAFSICCQYFHW